MGLSLKTCIKLMTEIFTKEKIEEFLKCKNDPVYFINNYVKLFGLCNIKLYPFQEKMVKQFNSNRFNLCASSRQSGKTLVTSLYLLHQLIFVDNTNILIIGYNQQSAENILQRLKQIYGNLPNWLRMQITISNRNRFELENGSSIISEKFNLSLTRSQNFKHIFFNEVAFASDENVKQFFECVFPCVSAGRISKLHLVSTKKNGSYFNKLIETHKVGFINRCLEFIRILFGKKKVPTKWFVSEYNWNVVPGRNKKWKQEMIDMIGVKAFNEEFQV